MDEYSVLGGNHHRFDHSADSVFVQTDSSKPKRLLTGSIILLVGMILDRFDVSWLAVKHPDPITYIPTFMANNVHYFPSLPEVSISIGIFSAGILAFGLAIKYLPIFEDENSHTASH